MFNFRVCGSVSRAEIIVNILTRIVMGIDLWDIHLQSMSMQIPMCCQHCGILKNENKFGPYAYLDLVRIK